MHILTESEVQGIKSIPDTDLARDQFDPTYMVLILSRGTLDALCESHELLRAEVEELKKERYVRSLYGKPQVESYPLPGTYGPNTLEPINQLRKDVDFLADVVRSGLRLEAGSPAWNKLKHISDPTYPG